MGLVNATKTKTWGLTTPNSGEAFDAEFDQLYANDTDLDSRLTVVEGNIQIPLGVITGLELEYATAGTLKVKAGSCRDDSDTADMVLASDITKNVLASFAEGDTNGAQTAGMTTAAGDNCHVFEVKNKTTGVVDIMIDNDADGANVPSTHYKKLIGSLIFTATNTLIIFNVVDGWVIPKSPGDGASLDINIAATTTASLNALFIPTGRKTLVILLCNNGNAGSAVMISDPDRTDVLPSLSEYPLGVGTTAGNKNGRQYVVNTDTSAQIRVRASASTAFRAVTTAWKIR